MLRFNGNLQLSLQHAVDLAPDGLEELVLLDPLDEVVLSALLLHDARSFVGVDPNLFVSVLARSSSSDRLHDDGLGDHEGQFCLDMAGNDLGVHNQTIRNVVEADQNGVGEKERLGDINAADSAVIEGPFALQCLSYEVQVTSETRHLPIDPTESRQKWRAWT